LFRNLNFRTTPLKKQNAPRFAGLVRQPAGAPGKSNESALKFQFENRLSQGLHQTSLEPEVHAWEKLTRYMLNIASPHGPVKENGGALGKTSVSE
jgi:hypothetical protein